MKDAGHIAVCSLENRQTTKGGMPREVLVPVTQADFEERRLGVTRAYLAQGVNAQIDLIARVWRDTSIKIGMYAVVQESDYDGQYRIDLVQHELDEDGLKVTDLTLSRINDFYDVVTN